MKARTIDQNEFQEIREELFAALADAYGAKLREMGALAGQVTWFSMSARRAADQDAELPIAA